MVWMVRNSFWIDFVFWQTGRVWHEPGVFYIELKSKEFNTIEDINSSYAFVYLF